MKLILKYIRKWWFGIVYLFTLLIENCIRHTDTVERYYLDYFYFPLQSVKILLYQDVIISVGDVLYIALAIILLIALLRLMLSFTHKSKDLILRKELFRCTRLSLLIYVVFVWSWGFNYDRKPLMYEAYKDVITYDEVSKKKHFKDAYTVNQLVDLLDTLQQDLLQRKDVWSNKEWFDIERVNKQSVKIYDSLLTEARFISALKISSIRSALQSLGIQGYFIPFTGEVHYSGDLFYIHTPFVFAHEMAHQLGIASETDANLMAYAVCTASNDSIFRASATFNLLLYILGDIKRIDEQLYESYMKKSMAPELVSLIAELKSHRAKYKSGASQYFMGFYDKFLKFFGQKEGLNSYNLMSYKVILYRNNNWTVKKLYTD
jgi:hypothetical protein